MFLPGFQHFVTIILAWISTIVQQLFLHGFKKKFQHLFLHGFQDFKTTVLAWISTIVYHSPCILASVSVNVQKLFWLRFQRFKEFFLHGLQKNARKVFLMDFKKLFNNYFCMDFKNRATIVLGWISTIV